MCQQQLWSAITPGSCNEMPHLISRLALPTVSAVALLALHAHAGTLADGPSDSVNLCATGMQYASGDTDSAQFTGQCDDGTLASTLPNIAPTADPLPGTWEELTNLDPYPTKKRLPKPTTATQSRDADSDFTYAFTYDGTADRSLAPASSGLVAKTGDQSAPDTPELDDTPPGADETSFDEVPQYQITSGDYSEASPAPTSPTPSSRDTHWLKPQLMGLLLVPLALFIAHRRRWLSELWNRCEALIYGARRVVEVDDIDIHTCIPVETMVRGIWSPELLQQMFGRPDYVVRDPQGLRMPLRFYDRNRVAQVQAGKKFKQHLARIDADNARTAAKIRRWVVLCQLDNIATDNSTPPLSAAPTNAPAAAAPQPVPVASR